MSRPHEMPTERIDVSPKSEYGGGVVRGAILTLGDDPRASTKIELIQYVDPPASPRPRNPRNQVGVQRIAMRVKDIDGMVDELKAAGVTVPLAPTDVAISGLGGRQRFALLPDPDENMIELVELFR